MKRVIALVARVISLCLYPILGIFLHNSRRTRVLLLHDNKVLLVRSYADNQKWSLPGGGIHKNEKPIKAATRELLEETGVVISEDSLKCIGENRLPVDRIWPRYAVIFYIAHLSRRPKIKITRPFEIIEAQWFSLDELPKKLSQSVHDALNNLNHSI